MLDGFTDHGPVWAIGPLCVCVIFRLQMQLVDRKSESEVVGKTSYGNVAEDQIWIDSCK